MAKDTDTHGSAADDTENIVAESSVSVAANPVTASGANIVGDKRRGLSVLAITGIAVGSVLTAGLLFGGGIAVGSIIDHARVGGDGPRTSASQSSGGPGADSGRRAPDNTMDGNRSLGDPQAGGRPNRPGHFTEMAPGERPNSPTERPNSPTERPNGTVEAPTDAGGDSTD